jgi:ATP-dependent RNA helicase HelY
VVTIEGQRGRLGAVVSVGASRSGAPLASLVTDLRRLERVGPREYHTAPQVVGHIDLPTNGGPRNPDYRKEVAAKLRDIAEPVGGKKVAPSAGSADTTDASADEVKHLRATIREHPVHADPSLSELEQWAYRTDDLRMDTNKMAAHVRRRTGSLVVTFDQIVTMLAQMGYLSNDPDPIPTADGMRLARVYGETDLLLAECIRAGVLDDLAPADLAAVASIFVYEWRSKDEPELVLPTPLVARAFDNILDQWEKLTTTEHRAGLPLTREPDPLFADTIWRWASGADLDEALGHSELTAGDFVRSVKQTDDLLRQIRDAYPHMSMSAGAVSKRIIRGVVAFSGM